MTKIDIVKKVVSIIVGTGTSTIVGSIIRNNVSKNNTLDKVTVPVATLAIGYMASDATRDYTDRKIDDLVDWWRKNITD